jgi:hypothetical protein
MANKATRKDESGDLQKSTRRRATPLGKGDHAAAEAAGFEAATQTRTLPEAPLLEVAPRPERLRHGTLCPADPPAAKPGSAQRGTTRR